MCLRCLAEPGALPVRRASHIVDPAALFLSQQGLPFRILPDAWITDSQAQAGEEARPPKKDACAYYYGLMSQTTAYAC